MRRVKSSSKSVTFSPQLTNVQEYNSPYCDPSFMASPDHDVWKQRLTQHHANIKLNFIEEVNLKYHVIVYILSFLQVLVEVTFHRHFEVCFDCEKQSSLEDIRQWFNGMLVGCGQKPWRKPGKKWAIAQSRFNLHVSKWQRREKPLPA